MLPSRQAGWEHVSNDTQEQVWTYFHIQRHLPQFFAHMDTLSADLGCPQPSFTWLVWAYPSPICPVLSHSFASWKCCSLTSWGWSHRVSMHRLASNPTHQAASVPAAEGLAAHLKLGTDRTALLWDYCCSSFTVPAAVQHPVKSHKYQGHQVSSNCVLKGLMVSAHYSKHNFQLANHRITEL